MEENCPECLGNGWVKKVKQIRNGKYYKLICNKCYGKKKLDWIEMITGVQLADIILATIIIEEQHQPDNYIIESPGADYYIGEEFFNPDLDTNEKFKHFTMTVLQNKRE